MAVYQWQLQVAAPKGQKISKKEIEIQFNRIIERTQTDDSYLRWSTGEGLPNHDVEMVLDDKRDIKKLNISIDLRLSFPLNEFFHQIISLSEKEEWLLKDDEGREFEIGDRETSLRAFESVYLSK